MWARRWRSWLRRSGGGNAAAWPAHHFADSIVCATTLVHDQCGAPSIPETTFTFRVDETLKSAFTNAAKAHDLPGSQLLRDFMREYVEKAEHDAWFRAEVEEGLREADDPNAEWVPHEQMKAEWEVRKAALLRRAVAMRKQRA